MTCGETRDFLSSCRGRDCGCEVSMTTIHEIIAADLAATAFDDTADETPVVAITWDPDGANISCNAIAGSVAITSDYGDGQDRVETRLVTVQTADVAESLIREEVVVVIGSDKWKVVEVERVGYGSAAVQVARKVPVARAHEGHTKGMV